MTNSTENTNICRLCLETEKQGGFLVEIFSSLVNETGGKPLNSKIYQLFSISIQENDGLSSMICHKCLVSVENFEEFKDQCQENDKKLRLLFNLPASEIQEEEVPEDISMLPDLEGHQIILLDPSKLYESSDSDDENGDVEAEQQIADKPEMMNDGEVIHVLSEQNQEPEQAALIQPPPISVRKEAFHCNYCDIAFSDPLACSEHEQTSHDPQYPFACGLPNCNFKCDNRNSLVIHIKDFHRLSRPFVCKQCNKTFARRSDLKKHAFVHSGIRSFVCDICSKSFTRNTNLTKHKRIHSEVRGFKCNLCPENKGFVNKSDLTRHLEIHMDRPRSLQCKYCIKVFHRRDKLLLHQKTHIQSNGIAMEQPIANTPPVNQSVVFYNQPVDIPPTVSQATPLNFYTENMIINLDPYNEVATPANTNFMIYQCDKCIKTFPSMALLQSHQDVHLGIKNFLCIICNKGYVRKKELDRHMMTSHSDKSYDCTQCSKKFKRKDKLVRHERSHQVEKFFNCPLCPAMACSLCELVGLCVMGILLFSMSNRFKFYVKMSIFMILSIISATLPIPLMLPKPRDYRNALIPAYLVIKIGQLLGVTFEIQGLENINQNKGAVVLINHQSSIDLMVLGKLWPVIGRACVVCKKELFYVQPFGLACYLWGSLFINRENKSAAKASINVEAKAINEKMAKILFFPEGTRNQSGTLLPFKKGPFFVAIDSQCSIQPIVVSKYHFLNSQSKIFGRGNVIIKVLPEVNTKGLSKADMEVLITNVQNTMQEEFEKVSDE
ncbi:unnamed protein product, partial [Diamesa tonsa]